MIGSQKILKRKKKIVKENDLFIFDFTIKKIQKKIIYH